jgi:perosamine synthetase
MIRGVNEPFLFGNELKYLENCIKKNEIASIGSYLKIFKKKLEKFTKAKYVTLCSSGTSAIQIALKALGIKPNEEVIVPTFTFIATVNAIIYNNAIPVFMDCDDYCNIDTKKLIEFLISKTYFRNGNSYNKKTNRKISALIIVHVWGGAANLKELLKICKIKKIKIIEDAAESFGTKYKNDNIVGNKHTGTIGDIGCLSFNGNKIITTAGGGAIITNNKYLAKKSSYLINQATDNSFAYIHKSIGYNFRMSNINAAIGLAQLENFKVLLKKKKFINEFYRKELKKTKKISILDTPQYSNNNYWQSNLLIKSKNYKKIILKIKKKLINQDFGIKMAWYPCHKQIPYKNYETYKIKKANYLSKRIICLPSSSFLKKSDLKKISNLILESL